MEKFEALWQGGPVFAQAEHVKLSTDCVLLADFIDAAGAKRGVDLGCASGAIALLLLAKDERVHMTGLELVGAAAELARENMVQNGYAERSRIITGDIRRHRELFTAGKFDLVAANPPYFPVNSGKLSPDSARAKARGETDCTLEDICAAAAFLCRTGGSFCTVYKPERLSVLFHVMTKYGIEPKRLRLVCHKASSAPSLVLVEGRRGGRAGLRIEPALILANEDGTETQETKRIYHRL